jgi:hypothetical protein
VLYDKEVRKVHEIKGHETTVSTFFWTIRLLDTFRQRPQPHDNNQTVHLPKSEKVASLRKCFEHGFSSLPVLTRALCGTICGTKAPKEQTRYQLRSIAVSFLSNLDMTLESAYCPPFDAKAMWHDASHADCPWQVLHVARAAAAGTRHWCRKQGQVRQLCQLRHLRHLLSFSLCPL